MKNTGILVDLLQSSTFEFRGKKVRYETLGGTRRQGILTYTPPEGLTATPDLQLSIILVVYVTDHGSILLGVPLVSRLQEDERLRL